jgi:hypothetical protein
VVDLRPDPVDIADEDEVAVAIRNFGRIAALSAAWRYHTSHVAGDNVDERHAEGGRVEWVVRQRRYASGDEPLPPLRSSPARHKRNVSLTL